MAYRRGMLGHETAAKGPWGVEAALLVSPKYARAVLTGRHWKAEPSSPSLPLTLQLNANETPHDLLTILVE